MLAKIVGEILSVDQVFNDVDIYLTGDGLSYFKGAKKIIKDITGHEVFEYKNPFDNKQDKYQTSKTSLACLANIVV